MEQNQKKEDILIFEEKQSGKLSVVSDIDKSGKVQTVEPKNANGAQFLKITSGDMLKNFMSNFLTQYNDPARFGLHRLLNEKVEESVEALKTMLQKPDNKEIFSQSEVKFSDYAPARAFTPIDESRIDWRQFETIGVSRDQLEKSGELQNMLEYRKTSTLIPISVQAGENKVYTEARLAFRESPEGGVNLAIHAIRSEPTLDYPFMGHRFTEEDKHNLLAHGNLGRIVELSPSENNTFAAFVSVDPLTKELIALRTDRINIPQKIMGVTLTEEQQNNLSAGKAVYVENMQSRNGKEFSATLQVNAEKRGLDFTFDNTPAFSERQTRAQDGEKRIPKELCGLQLTDKQHEALTQGRTLFLKNMTDKQGQPFNAYVKYSDDENRLRFYKWNPDKSKEKTVAVAEESKTQVAVNNEGKTNEATKDIKEPLKKGQTGPDAAQKEKQEEKKEQEQTKKRGRKM